MKWAVIVVRTLLGLLFVWAAAAYFGKLMEAPPLPEGSPAVPYMTALGPTGYMDAVKVVELVGGLLLLTGRLAPLGLALITPVAVNILFYDLFLLRQPAFGVGATAACVFLMWGYRSYFARFFVPTARIG
ncbi:MAG: hypothetical protein K2X82_27065 [Gemmataceae bacterium]|nr:hypothetical protein [Gemmataceae bacterium]